MVQAVIITDFAGDAGFSRSAGAYRVAAELRNSGYTVQVIDHFTSIVRNNIEPMRSELGLYYRTNLPQKNSKIISFGIPLFLNLGYDLNDMLTKPIAEVIKSSEALEKKYQLADSYYQQLLNNDQ